MAKLPAPPALGKNLLKCRKQMGITLDELSRRSGVSKAMLSQIEQDKTNPTVAVVWKIAHGLGISLQDLLGGAEGDTVFEVFHQHQYAVLSEGEGCEIQVISPIHMAGDLELYLIDLKQGAALKSRPHFEGAEEFTTVLEGSVEICSGAHSHEVATGDSAYYGADCDHAITNVGTGPARLYMVVHYKKVTSPD